MRWFRLALVLAVRSVIHPRDGVALLRLGWRFRRRRWFLRFPFLPLPARDYVRWRMHTAYGDDAHVPKPKEVVQYARWATRDS
jgi:hypothetical protein